VIVGKLYEKGAILGPGRVSRSRDISSGVNIVYGEHRAKTVWRFPTQVYNDTLPSNVLGILKAMTKELDIRFTNLSYTARYARPTFNLWGKGGKIVEALYDALSPYGAALPTIQAASSLPNASTPLLTIGIGNAGNLKFAYDRLEFTFLNFTGDFFRSLPGLFSGSTKWLRTEVPKFQFASHEFNYFNHSYIKEMTTEEFLASINPRILKSAGLSLGHGTIFHHAKPDRKWATQLILDKSSHLPNALFVGLNITVTQDDLNYENFLIEGRDYLASVLQELNLNLPELS
jgi:hypothetical protein